MGQTDGNFERLLIDDISNDVANMNCLGINRTLVDVLHVCHREFIGL